jgi:quercetin dioxygenase-like cupin family protein
VIVDTTIPLMSQSGWHHHPGQAFTYVLDGEGVVQIKGQAQPIAFKPGVALVIDDDVVHNAKNTGTTPLRILTVYVVDKGKPLTVPDNPPQQ